ncbi:MAG: DUF2071 domain-containing protein [Candidatus Acidiferrales bacterium]
MLPVMEGVIARRILLNWWVEPEAARRLVPAPFEPALVNGFAVAGICLLRLEQLRPAGTPAALGITTESYAHRIAVRYPASDGWRDGVYIWRRDTDSFFTRLLGGRLFPGVHGDAEFQVDEGEGALAMNVFSQEGGGDVSFRALTEAQWSWSLLFPRFTDVCSFFERGSRGFSCRLDGQGVEGMEMRTTHWQMSPLAVQDVRAAFFEDRERFPRGSCGFDSAAIMRGIPHSWHEISEVPELAVAGAR